MWQRNHFCPGDKSFIANLDCQGPAAVTGARQSAMHFGDQRVKSSLKNGEFGRILFEGGLIADGLWFTTGNERAVIGPLTGL